MAQQPSSDNSSDQIIALGVMIGIVLIAWHFMHAHISFLFFKLWIVELKIPAMFSSGAAAAISKISVANPSLVEFGKLVDAGNYVGSFTMWVYIPLMCGMMFFIFTRSPHEQHKAIYNIDSFFSKEADMWPQISPAIGLNLIKEDINKGPWASAMTEHGFAERHKLTIDGEVDDAKAEVVFTKQLGRLYYGPLSMPPHARAIFALCMLRIDDKMDEFKALRRRLAVSAKSGGKPNLTGVDDIVRRYAKHKVAVSLGKVHAYERTFMASLFRRAKHGVFPPNDFLWLKPIDRGLWYALHSVGMRVAQPESAGVRAHWLAESLLKKRLETPVVQEAIVGLKEAMLEVKTSTKDPLDDN